MQVARESVLAQLNISMVFGSRPFAGLVVHQLFKVAAVGEGKVQSKNRRQRLWRREVHLVHKRPQDLRSVGPARGEVPPFVSTGPVVAALSVLPPPDPGGG